MENVIYNLASSLSGSQVESTIGCLEEVGHLSVKLRDLGVESYLVPRMIPRLSMVYPGPLIRFIKESGCDIVHTHSGCWFKVAVACVYLPKVKLLYTEHGRTHPEPKAHVIMDRLSVHRSDRVIAVSDALQEYLVREIRLPARKVITIHNGIDTDRFAPAADRDRIRAEFGFGPENIVIGMVARLAPVKNQPYLVDAFERVYRHCPQARLICIGDGPSRGELEKYIASKNLGAVITLTGDRTDVARLVSAFDIATLSSRSEGISLTILEGMASGLPVVATRVGGNGEIITDGANGFLVGTDNIEAYSAKLTELAESAVLRKSFAENGRAHVKAHWSVTQMAASYTALYEELLSQK